MLEVCVNPRGCQVTKGDVSYWHLEVQVVMMMLMKLWVFTLKSIWNFLHMELSKMSNQPFREGKQKKGHLNLLDTNLRVRVCVCHLHSVHFSERETIMKLVLVALGQWNTCVCVKIWAFWHSSRLGPKLAMTCSSVPIICTISWSLSTPIPCVKDMRVYVRY